MRTSILTDASSNAPEYKRLDTVSFVFETSNDGFGISTLIVSSDDLILAFFHEEETRCWEKERKVLRDTKMMNVCVNKGKHCVKCTIRARVNVSVSSSFSPEHV